MGNCGSRKKGFNLTPQQNSNPVAATVFQINKAGNYIYESNLTVVDGCCCINHYLYTDVPACLGTGCNIELLCLDLTCCLRPDSRRLACLCCEARFRSMDAICRGQLHVCCCVQGCALPPGHGEPVIFAKFFVVLYPTIGICMPQQNVMMRL